MAIGKSLDDEVIEYLCHSRFHNKITLPATSSHGPIRVTYSFVGTEDEKAPVILWCDAMFGSRWNGAQHHDFAKKQGVRVIFVDRFGLGGSTEVPLAQRIPIWLETVPILLAHLNIQHVALACHSAGGVYFLNTLYHLPHILFPGHPYAAAFAPWVHPAHSSVSLMNAAASLPTSLVSKLDKVQGWVLTSINPAVNTSSGFIAPLLKPFKSAPSPDSLAKAAHKDEVYGKPIAFRLRKDEILFKWAFLEGTKGASEDAILLLKKSGPGLWGVCEDYEQFVPMLAKKLDGTLGGQRLTFRAFWAEEDMMIGRGGGEYFDRCFGQLGVKESIDYKGRVMQGTDHDNVCADFQEGIGIVYQEVKERWSRSTLASMSSSTD